MAWIEFHQALVTHHKLITFASELGVTRPQAAGHLAFLWCWALDNAKDGDLSAIPPIAVTTAAGWARAKYRSVGAREVHTECFMSALRVSGFVCDASCRHQGSRGGAHLHDWDDYAGSLISKRMSDAQRKRDKRTSSGHPADAAGTQPAPAPAPYPTQPNPTSTSTSGQPPPAEELTPHQRAYRAVENLTGQLNRTVVQAVDDALEGTEPEWVEAACEEAALNNARSWKYVAAILERWKVDGFKADRRQKNGGRGTGQRTDEFVSVFAEELRAAGTPRAVATERDPLVDEIGPA